MNAVRQTITVVAPCYNEAEVIGRFCQELTSQLDAIGEADWRIVLVDDGSTDGTLEMINALSAADRRIRVYSFSRNFGHQVALTAGLDAADGDAVIMMDSDLQHPPSLIPEMVRLWREGYDIVSAVRKDPPGLPLMKRLTSRGFYWLLNRLTRPGIVPGAADFCLLSRRAHRALLAMPERHRFLRGMVSWIGFRRALLDYQAADRAAGESKYTARRMLALAYDAIFSFSAVPITVASRLGLAAIALGLIYLAVVLFRYAVWGDTVRGWASTISVILIVGGLQLAFLGLLGQYLARVFEEVKRRPLYFFKQTPEDPGGAAGEPEAGAAGPNGRRDA